MKITFIFNNIQWQTAQQKVDNICAWFAPILNITPTIRHTNFSKLSIPTMPVSVIGGITNTPGTTQTVDFDWYTKNVTALSPDADIIVFVVDLPDVPQPHTSVGIMQGEHNSVVQTCIFGINENDHAYIYDKSTGLEMDQGNCFENFAEHEISHALYLIENQSPDNTHFYFYSGQPTKVLADLKAKASVWTNLSAALAQLKILVAKLTQQIMNTKPTTVIHPPKFPPLIIQWMKSIKNEEGADPASHNGGNLKYSTLTASWGAKQGRAATDGGHLCQFDTDQAGDDALCNFLVLGCEDELKAFHQARTIREFTVIYAGNPPQGYINAIVNSMGGNPDTLISTFIS